MCFSRARETVQIIQNTNDYITFQTPVTKTKPPPLQSSGFFSFHRHGSKKEIYCQCSQLENELRCCFIWCQLWFTARALCQHSRGWTSLRREKNGNSAGRLRASGRWKMARRKQKLWESDMGSHPFLPSHFSHYLSRHVSAFPLSLSLLHLGSTKWCNCTEQVCNSYQ